MANNKNNKQGKNRPSNAASTKPEAGATVVGSMASPAWTLGIVCLLAAAGASLVLVLQNLLGMAIPGCGEGSPCASLAKSFWGKVPGIGFPVSSLGLSYFIALLAGWLLARGGISNLFRWIVRAGVIASLFFLVLMVVKGQPCKYCIATHIGNLAFWAMMEWSSRNGAVSVRPSAATIGVFILACGVLAGIEWGQGARVAAKEEAELRESADRIARGGAESQTTNIATTTTAPATQPSTPTTSSQTTATQPAPSEEPRGFTGRYLAGPENAPIRIVIFSDYQCSDCRGLEMQAKVLLGTRNDVSLSAKQFPLDMRCNPAMGSTMHDNACKAAKMAEAAGLLHGNDGFWKMHHWLFERGGQFTDADLQQKLQEWGFSSVEFDKAMNSAEVADRIRADAMEAQSLGILFTPMVFINGSELRGFRAERALIRAVESVAAANLPPGSALNDRPPLAGRKYVEDWRQNPKQMMPEPAHSYPPGIDVTAAKVRIDVFGDLQDPNSAELDAKVRDLVGRTSNVVYVFHPFPFDMACNSIVARTVNPLGCRAARAAETAGILDGNEGYWKMQQWLLANRETFTDETLREAAVAQGFDADKFFETLESTAVSAAVGREIAGARSLGVVQLPSAYVNGRFLPRWKLDNADIIGSVFEAAIK